MTDVLEVQDVVVEYRVGEQRVRAVDGVTISVRSGEILGVIGESGCGKSSLARAIVGLNDIAAGQILFSGQSVAFGRGQRPRSLRPLQMVFQDPSASLNYRRRVGSQLADGIKANRPMGRVETSAEVLRLLEVVGLPYSFADRYPHQLSGGQRQRVAIARTLASAPDFIVADEPISGLDASAQASIAGLFRRLADQHGIGIIFISHDLAVVRELADRIAVMYLGQLVEIGQSEQVGLAPEHPYSQALLGAVPLPDGSGELPTELAGEVPNPANPPGGCRFHPRCPVVESLCATTPMKLTAATSTGHLVRCIHVSEIYPRRSA
ncbi:ABC transporter ATP-binding protein [Luethyella okanaganae]|uniref:ABC transporter ATP-binding protein n=1 Tax=Luethyella okanaganae TaxID=69372 RepID=A0ABW1VHZ2_9MICO